MRRASRMVFDEYVSGPGVRAYTSDQVSDLLGQFDQISLQLIVDDIDAAGTLELVAQHSADGIHFVDKSPLIAGAPLLHGETTILTASDPGTTPSLTYVRFYVTLATTARAHVRIHVTLRDEGVAGVVVAPHPRA